MNKVRRRTEGRTCRSQRGFTSVDLAVACAILVMLAAAAVPSVALLISHIKADASAAELSNVQKAMDAMMTDKSLKSVTAVTTATNDMTAFPDSTSKLSDYLGTTTTKGTYTCTSSGVVTQATTGHEC